MKLASLEFRAYREACVLELECRETYDLEVLKRKACVLEIACRIIEFACSLLSEACVLEIT